MHQALDMGVSVREFWQMSPRAIWLLTQEQIRSIKRRSGKQPGKPGGQRLTYIPR